MNREYLPRGVQYIEGRLGLGRLQRRLGDGDYERLESYLSGAPDLNGMRGKNRWMLYLLLRHVPPNLHELGTLTWQDLKQLPLPEQVSCRFEQWMQERSQTNEQKVFTTLPVDFGPADLQTMLDIDCQKAGINLFKQG